MTEQSGDDELVFVDEAAHAPATATNLRMPWKLLIVDDDSDVHTTTTFALRGAEILGQPLAFLHAHSAAEARELLQTQHDIAVILLDVVMEEEDSGLTLVRSIRDEFGMHDTRIILRTGQPGQAPEMEAIRDYDINDYKTKSELTRSKLFTALTSAVRSYRQLRTINENRRGLDLIVRASGELLAMSGLRNFADGVIIQLSALLGTQPEGLICARHGTSKAEAGGARVIAAAGPHASLIDQPLEHIYSAPVREALQACLDEERHLFGERNTTLFFSSHTGHSMAAYFDTPLQMSDANKGLIELFCTNISIGLENTRLFSQMHELACFDSLTGLANRHSLLLALDQHLQAPHDNLALALIDLDGFSASNAMFGSAFSDALLKAIAMRLREALGDTCTLARVSSDSFAALGPVAALQPEALDALFRQALDVESRALMQSATCGLVHLDARQHDSAAQALEHAHLALRQAQREQRGGCVRFTTDMAEGIRERARIMQALHHAIEARHIFLMYQPQISLTNGQVHAVEALARWRDPDGRLIEPSCFIPLAEHAGLIGRLGAQILDMACRHQVALRDAGHDDVTMCVNISVAQFRQAGFVDSLRQVLADTGIAPQRLELELTESMAREDSPALRQTLQAIKALGVRLAVDDFGTGFSSLSCLRDFAVDRLKIDRSFIADMVLGLSGQYIPAAVTELGHQLHLSITAEGVETREQAEMLQRMGCDDAQGYLFARPMEMPALLDWLAARPAD